MGRISIAIYRPKKGKEKDLLKLIDEHLPILQTQNLVTNRKPIVMKAQDQSIIEIFEWASAEAITAAHTNPVVGKLWERFGEVCDFEIPINVKEFQNMFSEFEPVN
jgi:hypothetical protein